METHKEDKQEQDLNDSNNEEALNREQVQLTEFLDTGVKMSQSMVSSPGEIWRRITNPYPDQTPVNILTRNYKVAQYSWGSSLTGFTLNFPGDLIAVPALADRLENFLYMRAGVKIEVKINSTQFHYGAFMISWLPNHATIAHCRNIFQQSGNHPIVLSPAVQNTCVLNIPWINPYNYFPVASPNSQICRVDFSPLTPLGRGTDSVTDTVSIQVYASFTEPEVAGFIAQSGVGKMKREARDKAKDGTLVQVNSIVDSVKEVLDKVPIIGGLIENFGSILGLFDKPLNVEMVQPVTQSLMRDLSLGKGADNSNPLSLLPLSNVKFDFSLLGETTDILTIRHVIQTPMLYDIYQFNTANTLTFYDVQPQHTENGDDYLAFMSKFFQFWRGSIKFMLNFYCSTFTSARFRVSVLYSATALTDDNGGDIVSRVIDVKGDTHIKLTIPYLYQTMFRKINDHVVYPKLQIQLLSPIIGPSVDTDPQIYMTIWRSAGEDMVFNQQTNWIDPLTSLKKKEEPRSLIEEDDTDSEDLFAMSSKKEPCGNAVLFEAQMDPQKEFKKTFDPIIEGSFFVHEQGTISGERIELISDMIKRYIYVTGNVAEFNALQAPSPTVGLNGAYFQMGNIFKYWRGSRRSKLYLESLTFNQFPLYGLYMLTTSNAPSDPGNGLTVTTPNIWPLLEAEIPWYCTLPFVSVNTTATPISAAGDLPIGIGFLTPDVDPTSFIYFASAGDDFSFGFMYAPDPLAP